MIFENKRNFPLVIQAHEALPLRHSQTIFRSTNHKRLISANWGPCLIYIILKKNYHIIVALHYPDSKVRGSNMGLIWGRQDPGGPHVGPMNLAIWVYFHFIIYTGSPCALVCYDHIICTATTQNFIKMVTFPFECFELTKL